MLFIFTEPSSPKINDLCKNGHYAMHCAVNQEGPLIEFLVKGSADKITDPEVRLAAGEIANSPVVTEGYVLFEFQIEQVLCVEYHKQRKPIVRRWKRPKTVTKDNIHYLNKSATSK